MRAETGIEAAFRVGLSHASGAVDGSAGGDLAAFVDWQVPLQLDLGYRISAPLFVGVYGSFGVGDFGSSWSERCERSGEDYGPPFECEARVYRVGAQAQYWLFPNEPVTPWLGLGLGWEALQTTLKAPDNEQTLTLSGFEFLNLQAGLDLSPWNLLSFGPYVEASVAQYTRRAVDCELPPELQDVPGLMLCESSNAKIADTALHEWITVGVRILLGPL